MLKMHDNPIDKIVSELRNSSNCKEALAHYNKMGANVSNDVLERGTTDFDRPYSDEVVFYKVEAYIHQYMDLHYKSNFAVLQKCKFLDTQKPCLFVDYGCGPMTSGLALMKRLKKRHAGKEVAYCGIDISRAMLAKAKQINGYYRLFSDAGFYPRIGNASAHLKMTVKNDFANDCIVVFNFSHVLSTMTLKGNRAVEQIVDAIAKISCYALEQNCPVYIIYQNPRAGALMRGKMHSNWGELKRKLTTVFAIKRQEEKACTHGAKTTYYAKIQIGPK